jgi:hypothetical protein
VTIAVVTAPIEISSRRAIRRRLKPRGGRQLHNTVRMSGLPRLTASKLGLRFGHLDQATRDGVEMDGHRVLADSERAAPGRADPNAAPNVRRNRPTCMSRPSRGLAPARRGHDSRSASKRPRHHQRELSLPQRGAVRRDPLAHDDVRTCIAQRGRPPGRVVEEERLQRAGDEISAASNSASRQSVCNPRPASRTGPHRRCRDAEAQERARALHPPRHRTRRYVRWAARLRNASAPIGGRPRRRTSRVPRTDSRQRPASTHGAATSHRPARAHRRSLWTVRRPPRVTRPTARSPHRHRRRRLPRADLAGRTPSPADLRRTRASR